MRLKIYDENAWNRIRDKVFTIISRFETMDKLRYILRDILWQNSTYFPYTINIELEIRKFEDEEDYSIFRDYIEFSLSSIKVKTDRIWNYDDSECKKTYVIADIEL